MPWPWELDRFRAAYVPYANERFANAQNMPEPVAIAEGLNRELGANVTGSGGIVLVVFQEVNPHNLYDRRDRPSNFTESVIKTAKFLASPADYQAEYHVPDKKMPEVVHTLKLSPNHVRKATERERSTSPHHQFMGAAELKGSTIYVSGILTDPRHYQIFTYPYHLGFGQSLDLRRQRRRARRGRG